mmetsp:Transcript_1298/g.2058  ORF Transcript_1298/g.2058 Transcript_1298/m.2058 type:complete len:200 (+) Transcript_1298:2248-2847(+)
MFFPTPSKKELSRSLLAKLAGISAKSLIKYSTNTPNSCEALIETSQIIEAFASMFFKQAETNSLLKLLISLKNFLVSSSPCSTSLNSSVLSALKLGLWIVSRIDSLKISLMDLNFPKLDSVLPLKADFSFLLRAKALEVRRLFSIGFTFTGIMVIGSSGCSSTFLVEVSLGLVVFLGTDILPGLVFSNLRVCVWRAKTE